MAGIISPQVIKDGNGTAIVGGVRMFDVSGTLAGPWVPVSLLYDPNSGAVGTIKPASTIPAATDPALVVALSPNSWDKGAGTAGTATQRVIVDSSQFGSLGQTTMNASAPIAVASDQSPIPVIQKPSATANGQTSSRINSAATSNATSLKASAGQVGEIDIKNVAAYSVFFKFYNKASAPTLALATPVNAAFVQSDTGGTLVPSTTYWYRVSAINANGETLASTETSQATSATAGNTHSMAVNWGAVTGATGYKIYGRTTGAEQLIGTVGVTTTFTDPGSAPSGALPAANTTFDTPFWTIPLLVGEGFARSFPRGKTFATGIAYAITKNQADSDATVVVAGDLTGSIDWI